MQISDAFKAVFVEYFRYEIGDVVAFKSTPTSHAVVVSRYLMETPAGFSPKYVLHGSNGEGRAHECCLVDVTSENDSEMDSSAAT